MSESLILVSETTEFSDVSGKVSNEVPKSSREISYVSIFSAGVCSSSSKET